MLGPILIALLLWMAYAYASWILKYRQVLYVVVWLVLGFVVIFRDLPFMLPFIKGFVGFAFFYVVMITGALNPQWLLTKKLKSVRTPYSILGFILLLAHPLYYATEVLSQQREIPVFGVAAFVIMIPLFISSYISIRKRMNPQSWNQLQRWAYPAYGLILVHLVVNASTLPNRILAILLFIPYIVIKLKKEGIFEKYKVKVA